MPVTRRDSLLLLVGAAIAVAFTWTPLPQWSRYWAAVALLWLLPAGAWYRVVPGSVLMRAVSALGLAFVTTGLSTLVLHLLPGPFPGGWARVAALALIAIPLWITWCRSTPSRPTVPEPSGTNPPSEELARTVWHLGLLAVVLLTLLLRVTNLSYSEVQGDEAVILQRAADALAGDDDELFLHQKGPVEILVPMSLWALTETISEWQARLPFALAGLLAVLTVAALADRWFGRRAGVFAGLLIAINGFLVAFGRIVQYQNLVVAMGGLCLLWLLEGDSGNQRRRLIISAIFLAFGLLAHYDAVLVAPAAIAVLWQRMVREGGSAKLRRRLVGDLVLAVVAGGGVLALFYVPFVANPMFSRTFSYLVGGRLGGSLLNVSLWDVWRMSTFYNALYYVLGLILLVAAAALFGHGSWASWLYFVIPFLFYGFVVADPRTHVYTLYPGAAALAGAVLASLPARFGASRGAWLALGGGLGLWYGLCVGFIGMAFVSHAVEYKRAWPASRTALYPVPFADHELPPYGHFGFPYRAGWKAVAYLHDRGIIQGTYASNEEPEITTWYLPGATRTLCDRPDVYIVADRVQDEIAINWEELDRDYMEVARVSVADRTKIRVYSRSADGKAPLVLAAEDAVLGYDAQTTVGRHQSRPPVVPHRAGADFGTVGRLLGYALPTPPLTPGDPVRVTLVWQALSSPDENYQVFVHLMDGDELIAQHDGAPACAKAPTSLWEAGESIRDEHTIVLDAAIPDGTYDIYVGMYHLLTLDRLPVDGGPNDRLHLARLEVIPEATGRE